MMRRTALMLFLALLPASLSAATQVVTVGPGLIFNPKTASINVGDTVTWNFAESNHTTTSNATTGPETWNSGIRFAGNTFSHTFTTAGSYPYYCAVHSFPGLR